MSTDIMRRYSRVPLQLGRRKGWQIRPGTCIGFLDGDSPTTNVVRCTMAYKFQTNIESN
ncbi:hypothetical protein FOXB_13476 [Fusarium oxysporum f. sp. conglutinans Fo5176]|uniref:Uncharacterized protein n=1 Tax=Fusarium oxysporum (strain Fo5176) TaxID=660025 RepID=F9G494_FUSOF|nr:hypothetical protein FOXB_13476 [Fusarium oxysporum f. sp. conglutinans Fo5176]